LVMTWTGSQRQVPVIRRIHRFIRAPAARRLAACACRASTRAPTAASLLVRPPTPRIADAPAPAFGNARRCWAVPSAVPPRSVAPVRPSQRRIPRSLRCPRTTLACGYGSTAPIGFSRIRCPEVPKVNPNAPAVKRKAEEDWGEDMWTADGESIVDRGLSSRNGDLPGCGRAMAGRGDHVAAGRKGD